jgi:hypothetical protein
MPIETDQELLEKVRGYDMSIYQQKYPVPPYDYTPFCIHFYYIRINENGALAIDHYLYGEDENGNYSGDEGQWVPIHPDSVEAITRKLAMNARPRTRDKSPPKLPDHNFNNMLWTRRTHLVFFFDEQNWNLHDSGTDLPAVFFKGHDGVAKNFSFFDAKDMIIDMAESGEAPDQRSAVRLINHMKRNNEGDLMGDERIDHKFDILLRVNFAFPDTKKLTVIFDPPGPNQGPPGQP